MKSIIKSFRFWVIFGVLLILFAIEIPWFVDYIRPSNLPSSPDRISNEQIFREDPLLQQGGYSGATDPSFEMRENVDFLLTPAILVQESISDDVILTYPEE
jgi:hypothetical protein